MPDLLINGPIESNGISGAEAHIEKRRFPKDAIKSFNTIDNVINIVKKIIQNLIKLYGILLIKTPLN